jgi:hypothetical protein
MITIDDNGNRNVNKNTSSLAHWARKISYRRAFHSYKDYRRNRQENTQQTRQIRNNKSPTLMARMRVLRNPRHLFFLSSFIASVGALIAFLLVSDRSRLAELAIGMIHR